MKKISLTDIDNAIKHYQGLQKRYTTQHKGIYCKHTELSLYVLTELRKEWAAQLIAEQLQTILKEDAQGGELK